MSKFEQNHVETMAAVGKSTGAFKVGQGPLPPLEPGGEGLAREVAPPAFKEATFDAVIADAVEAVGGKLTLDNVRGLIVQECRELEQLLLEKNAGYGNSALDPIRLFSHSGPIEQLKVRIDDKLSRISRGDLTKVKGEDLKVVTKDLLGYLILIRVAWRLGLE